MLEEECKLKPGKKTMTHVHQVSCLNRDIEYILDLVRLDLQRKRQTLQRATIPQRCVELRTEIDEIEALKERLNTAKA
jgi:hypothetical protein